MSALHVSHLSSPTQTEEVSGQPIGASISDVNSEDYYAYLNYGLERKSQLNCIKEQQWTTIQDGETFVACAMEMSQYISDMPRNRKPLLRIKLTEREVQPNHFTHTSCKPALVAAFEGDWSPNDERKVKSWGLIHLVGEVALSEKTKEDQLKQAVSYIHYLILAHPDLYIVHGLLIDEDSITFLAGITGKGIYRTKLQFTDERLLSLLFALIYHLYDPGTLRDEHYKVTYNDVAQTCLYTLSIRKNPGQEPSEFSALELKYASSPFGSCTYVFVVHSELGQPMKMKDGMLRVIKGQYCGESRFNEPEILKHIHADGFVPGVIKLVHDESWDLPKASSPRIKRRLGFEQNGFPFLGIKTVKGMLEAAFDLLEVTRYLRNKCNVLHRDISVGNILVVPDNLCKQAEVDDASSVGDNAALQKPDDICFVKHLLGESSNPCQTNVILIDFNRSERLDVKNDRAENDCRTGTPLFMARAIQHGQPYPQINDKNCFDSLLFPPMPMAPTRYAQLHPQRAKEFDDLGSLYLDPHTAAQNLSQAPCQRHELYHDAESIYWLVALWLMFAKPMQPLLDEPMDVTLWSCITGNISDRHIFITALLNTSTWPTFFLHSSFEPLKHLLIILSATIRHSPHCLENSDLRTHSEYVHEAFQRAILNFILKYRDMEFMTLPIDSQRRQLPRYVSRLSIMGHETFPTLTSVSTSTSTSISQPPTSAGSKRPSSASIDEKDTDPKRRRCVD